MESGLSHVMKKLLLVLILCSCGFSVLAQGNNWTYIQIDSTKQMWGDWDEPDWLRYFGLDVGDVDNDGNLDIVSGRYVYHNPGGNMETPWKRTVLDDNVDAILYVDVDGDPYADIIAMALPNLYWYEAINAEGTRYKRRLIGNIPATSHVNSQGFEKAQLTQSGRSEFVIAGNGDIYAISVPEGDPEKVDWKVNMICKNTSDEGIGVGDIDGDGDLDIAAGRRPDGEEEPKILVWFENPGHLGTLWKDTVVGESEHPIDRVEIADINGDGKADIVVTEERYPGKEPDANLWWFEQQGRATWSRHNIVTQFSMNNLDITDFDKDGDIDLLTAEHKGNALELQLWKNDGQGNFIKSAIDSGKENHLGTQFVDLDNDGDLDIIGAGWDQHQYMHVWRNDAIKSLKTGMLFKEYPWVPDGVNDDGKFLRVGGKLDYKTNSDHFPQENHENGFIPLPHPLDLDNAIAAEVLVERVQSHEDTKNLRIQWNGGKPIYLPEPSTIPKPAADYMFHSNIRVPVPLQDLRQGNQNSFRLTVAKEQSWDWPQNLVYGIVLRIYYDNSEKQRNLLQLSGVDSGDNISSTIQLSVSGDGMENLQSVAYMGLYEDVDYQGNGKYRQWQYRMHRGKRQTFIGSSNTPPFTVEWNTDWIPDQSQPIQLSGLATDKDGFTHVLQIVKDVRLNRKHSVYLAKPYAQDPFWTTRNGEHSQFLDIPFKPAKNDSARLYWNSWSPCYSEGIAINGNIQKPLQGLPCYDAHWHEEEIFETKTLKRGKNELKTLKTPLHNGQMVHGMDVQWPGIMVKVKTQKPTQKSIEIVEGTYENRPHYIIYTKKATYYFDKAGGGFSRIIDTYGNDWISYKTEPWNEYPASAASAFRGLPNLVFASETDGGAGHPGHDKCVSEVSAPNSIKTLSKSGAWEWQWTFYDDHAVLNIVKTKKNTPYWFLYEGTPGGTYEPEASLFGTSVSGPHAEIPDFYKNQGWFGQFDWAYFGKKGSETHFYVANLADDNLTDLMSYLGNTEKGALSEDGMTVFGFGRGKNTKPLMTGKNSFLIGFLKTSQTGENLQRAVEMHIDKLIGQHKE